MLLSDSLSFLLLWFGSACPFMFFVCSHFLCAGFLEESFVVVACGHTLFYFLLIMEEFYFSICFE
jgi:hypothetical protein